MKWTLILRFWNDLPLAHFERCMFTLSNQTIHPTRKILFDNNSGYSYDDLQFAVRNHTDLSKWDYYGSRYGGSTRGNAWGNNVGVRLCDTDTFIMVRSDCLYHSSLCYRMLRSYHGNPNNYVVPWTWMMPYYSHDSNGFDDSNGFVNHSCDLEPLRWRDGINRLFMNQAVWSRHIHSWQESGTFCCSKRSVALVDGWDDKHFTRWGLEQRDFQSRLRGAGVKTIVIRRYLVFHMMHPADRSVDVAMREYGKACYDRSL